MKERFEQMTLEQLDAIYEVMCFLYPPMEGVESDTASDLWDDLEAVRLRKMTEYHESDEFKRKVAESDALCASMFQPWKEGNV